MTPGEAARGRHARRTRPGVSLAVDLIFSGLVPVLVVGGIFLSPFIADRRTLPFGSDTYGYAWRAELVQERGIEALTPEGTGVDKALGERPAHPILVALLGTATGATSLEIMWVLPAVLASSVALAASGLAADAASERRRTSGLVGIAVGGSAYVAWTAVGYSTNLAFDVVALAVASLAIRAAFGSGAREVAGAGFLLGGGALYHWILAPLLAAMLVAYSALLAIGRRLRSSIRPPPRAWLAAVGIVGCALVVAAVAFALAPELPARRPQAAHAEVITRLRLPAMALALTLPLATLGALVMALGRGVPPRRRWSAPFLLGWAWLGLVGLVGWYLVEQEPFLPYRLGGFALGIPGLIALGALAVRDLGRSLAYRVVALILAVAAAGTLAFVGSTVWNGVRSKVRGPLLGQLATVASYASSLPADTAVVLVGDDLPLDVVRAGLPPRLFDRVEVVRPDVVAAVPDLGRTDRFVVVALEAAIEGRSSLGGHELGRGVSVLRGPTLEVTLGTAARSPRADRLIGLSVACLAVSVVAGLGWALASTRLPMTGAVAIAPAFGLVAIGMFGLVADRGGVALRGVGGIVVVSVVAALGFVAAAGVRLRRAAVDAR